MILSWKLVHIISINYYYLVETKDGQIATNVQKHYSERVTIVTKVINREIFAA
jgi:hypothetical protein